MCISIVKYQANQIVESSTVVGIESMDKFLLERHLTCSIRISAYFVFASLVDVMYPSFSGQDLPVNSRKAGNR